MSKLDLTNKVWFFDIDDTLVDTAGTSQVAAEGIGKVFKSNFDEDIARKVTRKFNELFNVMMLGYRVKNKEDWGKVPGGQEEFDQTLKQVESCQEEVIEKYGLFKKWSREIFIKIAADRLGVEVSPELIHEAADAYWMTLTEKTEVFPGAREFFEYLNKKEQPIFLVTSSDARLKMKSNGQFVYDPAYSETLKRERIELLRDKGFDFRLMSVGDPEDKPGIEFFQKSIDMAEDSLRRALDPKECVMVGDSYGGDLETPHTKMDFGLVILFVKGQQSVKQEGERFISTGNLSDLID